MSVVKHPEDIFANGGGLLVHPTKYRPISSLKSKNKQRVSKQSRIINNH